MKIFKTLSVMALVVFVGTAAAWAQVPKPTINIVGSYYYDANSGGLNLNLMVTDAQYLDGSTSNTDPICGASFGITGLTYMGMDGDQAVFADGSILVAKGDVVYMSADLMDVRMGQDGFGSFGNINVGFGNQNVQNLVFGEGTGSQFVEEFAALIAPDGVPDTGATQLEMQLIYPFGQAPTTFEGNFAVSSVGSVLAVFDGAPLPDPCLGNVAPVIEYLSGDPLVVPIGVDACLEGYFSDEDSDLLAATWSMGDGSEDVVVAEAASPATICHAYTEAGIYTVTLKVEDDCGNDVTQTIIVVAYDPTAGFTTGGGWFIPDGESFIDGVPVTDNISKANFGFVVKYKKGASTPDGKLEFVYKKGNINLHSLDMDWMVIQSAKDVRFKGLATINGEGLYSFKVTGRDNAEPGTGIDTFKIEIWMGEVDTENTDDSPKHMAKGVLGGGNIQIHQ